MSETEFGIPKADGDEALEMPLQAENAETIQTQGKEHEDLAAEIKKLTEQIAGLGGLFESKILRTQHEEKIVDRMHKELQKYKEDMYSQLVRPILLDIIEIRDSILRISAAHHIKPEGERSIPLKTFEMYASDVQEILEKNNIEIFKSEVGSDLTPVRHRVIKKIPSPEENLHGKLAESLSDGYTYMERIITPEKVAVYIYEPQLNQKETCNTESNNQETCNTESDNIESNIEEEEKNG